MKQTVDLPEPAIEAVQRNLFVELERISPKVAVLLECRDDSESYVKKMGRFYSVHGKPDTVIIVLRPELLPEGEHAPETVYFARYGLHIICYGPSPVSQDGADAVRKEIIELLKSFQRFFSVHQGASFVFESLGPVTKRPDLLGFVAYFRQPRVAGNLSKTAAPVISYETVRTGLMVTLTCSTPSAQIWYTLDGTDPFPGRDTAKQYGSPFLIPTPAIALTLRTAAYADGKQRSEVWQMDVTPQAPALAGN
jgi:hypothetical protein